MGSSVGGRHGHGCSSMLAKVAVSMVALHMGQAYPTYSSLQGYSSVPAVPELEPYGALAQAKATSAKPYGALSFQPVPNRSSWRLSGRQQTDFLVSLPLVPSKTLLRLLRPSRSSSGSLSRRSTG